MTLPDLDQIGASWDAVADADEAFDRGDDREAIRLYVALADGAPSLPYASYRAGMALARIGERSEAYRRLRRAAELGNPLAMVDLARMLAPKAADEARSWLRRAGEAGYRDIDGLRADPSLRDLVASHEAELIRTMRPAEHDAHRRGLDFWLGDWEVRAADGRPAGRNTISSALSGTVIHEDWQSTAGWRGESVNFYNAEAGYWEQMWVQDDGSHTHYTEGRLVDGAMRFATSTKEGPRRLTLHPLSNGWVRQVGEAQGADGQWLVEYDLIYTPR